MHKKFENNEERNHKFELTIENWEKLLYKMIII